MRLERYYNSPARPVSLRQKWFAQDFKKFVEPVYEWIFTEINGWGISTESDKFSQIIFPELLRRGFPGPGEIISLQHQQLGVRVEELQQLVWAVDEIAFDAFKVRLQQLIEYIVPVMRRHIFIENNLILPLALELIEDPMWWARMKDLSDEIG